MKLLEMEMEVSFAISGSLVWGERICAEVVFSALSVWEGTRLEV